MSTVAAEDKENFVILVRTLAALIVTLSTGFLGWRQFAAHDQVASSVG